MIRPLNQAARSVINCCNRSSSNRGKRDPPMSMGMRFFVRVLGFPELRDWLLAAGFSRVDGYGPDGEPLTADSRRMLAVATR